MHKTNGWVRNRDNRSNSWKTFVVTFREHLRDEPTIRVVVKAQSEESAIEKAEKSLPALVGHSLARSATVGQHHNCDVCGDQFWRVSVLSPDVAGDFFDLAEFAEHIAGLRESAVRGVLSFGTFNKGEDD